MNRDVRHSCDVVRRYVKTLTRPFLNKYAFDFIEDILSSLELSEPSRRPYRLVSGLVS